MLPKITTRSPLLWATLLFAAPGLSTAQTVTEFNPTFGANQFLTSGSIQADARPIFGGNFTTVNGTAVARLARFDTSGTLDATLTVGADSASHVSSIVVHPDGSLTVGGNFSQFGGAVRANLARVTPAGALDLAFPTSSPNNQVRAIAMLPDGELLIGGSFSSVGGTTTRLARLNTDGSVDTDFTGTFAGGDLRGIAVQSDGRIVIVGGFTTVNGEARPRIARLNANGTTDTTFAVVASEVADGNPFEMFGVAVQPDGRILVLGNFNSIAGTARNRIARLNADGTIDTTFTPPTLAATGGDAISLALQADGKILIGGNFAGPGTGVIRVNADGTTDGMFGTVSTNNPPVIVMDGTGHFYVASPGLATVEGQSRDEVARVENPTAPTSELTLNGTTVSLELGGSAPVPSVVFFEASVNGTTWTALGSGAYDAGSQTWRMTGATIPDGTTELRAYAAYSINGIDSGLFMVTGEVDGDTTPTGSRLLNISTRAQVNGGDEVVIPGFVVSGSGTKQLLIRAVGPTLGEGDNPVADPLGDPRIQLMRLNTDVNPAVWVEVETNDNWGDNDNAAEIITVSAELFARELLHEEEAVLLTDLGPGQYTVVTSGSSDTDTGIALVEVYDADGDNPSAELINIATRSFAGVGEQVVISGFVVSSEGPKTVLVRAVGPGIAADVDGAIADPMLTIHRLAGGTSTVVATQDNWGENDDPDLVAEISAEVFAPALDQDSADAALVITLEPGLYTATAQSAEAGATGVVLIEVFAVPDAE